MNYKIVSHRDSDHFLPYSVNLLRQVSLIVMDDESFVVIDSRKCCFLIFCSTNES